VNVSDPVLEWRTADISWVANNHKLLETVYQWFLQEGGWPSVSALRRHLARGNVTTIDVQAIADAKPLVPGQATPVRREHISLGVRHLLGWPEAGPLLDLVVKVTQAAVTAFKSDMEQPAVSRQDFVNPTRPGQTALLDRVPQFISADNPNVFGGGTYEGEWRIFVNENVVMDFAAATSPGEYVSCQEAILRRSLRQQPGWQQRPAPSSLNVFVLMPFSPSWSGEAYAFVRDAARALAFTIHVFRADEIAKPGRITEQIIASIQQADALVADITDLNPNVMWELGYAHALERPVVILTQNVDQAPFDLHDYRQVEYAIPPSGAELQQLAAFLANALGVEVA
jgi:hypothetical protein